ncbi:unnamed protein product, partial [Rotaria magnacalcarata]
MPDYLLRSPVDDAEEDPDEISILISNAAQTNFDNIPNYLHVVTAVETRAMKLRNAKLPNTNNTEQLKSDSLDTSLKENRIIPFTNEQLKEVQQQEDCANKILNNIKKRKNYP